MYLVQLIFVSNELFSKTSSNVSFIIWGSKHKKMMKVPIRSFFPDETRTPSSFLYIELFCLSTVAVDERRPSYYITKNPWYVENVRTRTVNPGIGATSPQGEEQKVSGISGI